MNLEELDAYLSSDDSPENCMMLSDLDGFMHGIACSPVLISSEEWVPVALGSDPTEVPSWVLKMITTIYINIVEGLCRALLHKSGEGRASPFPRRTYPTGSVTGMPRAV